MTKRPVRIAVQDANLLIDLELAGLWELWFHLGIEMHTTDLIRAELERGGHAQALAWFKTGHIAAHSLTYEELAEVYTLEQAIGSKAKFNDCSVLFLATKLGAMLLSGDKALRTAGAERQVEVHGVLWIFDQLVEGELLSGEAAAAKLEHLRKSDRFLPAAECQARLRKWRNL